MFDSVKEVFKDQAGDGYDMGDFIRGVGGVFKENSTLGGIGTFFASKWLIGHFTDSSLLKWGLSALLAFNAGDMGKSLSNDFKDAAGDGFDMGDLGNGIRKFLEDNPTTSSLALAAVAGLGVSALGQGLGLGSTLSTLLALGVGLFTAMNGTDMLGNALGHDAPEQRTAAALAPAPGVS